MVFLVYGCMVLGLFFFSDFLISKYDFVKEGGALAVIKLEATIPAVLNLILILLCDEIYDELSEELTNFENHETISDYEMNYVFKKVFIFV